MTILGNGKGKALDACWNVWQKRPASAHYGVDGNYVRQFVWDRDYAWATGSWNGNSKSISIEHANISVGPSWSVAEDTWKTGAKLTGYIHYVHRLGRPSPKTVLKHSSWKSTACPGPFMDSIFKKYINEAAAHYDNLVNPSKPAPKPPLSEPNKPSKPVTARRRYMVTTDGLNARSGPGMKYPVKRVRKKGFTFTSSGKISGDWVQASMYWYHKNHLKDITPAPKPPVDTSFKVATFNAPLDEDKIPDGKKRVKIIAKQITKNGVDILGVQELSRTPGNDSHDYANMLLKALGGAKKWGMIEPTTRWNENYIFYNLKTASLQLQEDDSIIQSKAGGRHVTKAWINVKGRRILFCNTHLVSGKANGESREYQGELIASIVKEEEHRTILVGDFNQKNPPAALDSKFNNARTYVLGSEYSKIGTYVKWGKGKASTEPSAFLDLILFPKKFRVLKYELIGVNSKTLVVDSPRASDHLLTIATLED